jgi:hypothetical protein
LDIAIPVALMCGATFALISLAIRRFEQGVRRTALARIAKLLDGDTDGRTCARGTRSEVPVQVTLLRRGFGDDEACWTEVDGVLPASNPLSLHVRRYQRRDRGLIARSAMRDVDLGDPTFDNEFLIEAAPAMVVRRLLDVNTRAYLAAHAQARLTTARVGARPVLRLSLPGWRQDLDAATEAVDVVVHLVARLRDAYAEAEREQTEGRGGDPYRVERTQDDRTARLIEAGWVHEVARVDRLREERALHAGLLPWIAIGLAAAGLVALILVASW